MSPRDVYPEGNVMWQRAGESWADVVVQEAGEGDGELEGSQEPSTAHIPDPSITSHSRAVRRGREREMKNMKQLPLVSLARTTPAGRDGRRASVWQDTGNSQRWVRSVTPAPLQRSMGASHTVGSVWDTSRALFLRKALAG